MRIAVGTTIYHLARGLFRKRQSENRIKAYKSQPTVYHTRFQNCFFLRGFEKYLSDDAAASIVPKKFDFSAGYTQEEQITITKTINTGTLDELKSYSITEARIKKIIAHRDKINGFKTLNEILLFQGMDIAILDKFCKSIVRKKQTTKIPLANLKGELLIPPLDEDKRMKINTCTGIWVSGKGVSWAQLDTNCNLLEWNSTSLEEISMKDGLVAIVDVVAKIMSRVGSSDVYIMEADPIVPFSRLNSSSYYLNLQKQQVSASIASILGMRLPQVNQETSDSHSMINNIYMMRSRTPARLFNLLIGSENVSAESVVKGLIRTRHESELKGEKETAMFAHVDPILKKYYESQNSYQREQMNWALLLIVSFYNLSLMRSISIAQTMTTSGSRK